MEPTDGSFGGAGQPTPPQGGFSRPPSPPNNERDGVWVDVIHKCGVPNSAEVTRAQAQVGSVWECRTIPPHESSACGDKWKLIQISVPPGTRGNIGRFPKWKRLTINRQPITPEQQESADAE